VSAVVVIFGLFILLLASQLIAGEMTMGTMKNLLLCPIRRIELLTAKILSLLLCILTFLFLTAVVSILGAWYCGFAFLPEGAPPRDAVIKQVFISLPLIFFPMLATGALGLLISILVENAPLSMAISILFYIPLYLFSHFFQGRTFSLFLFPGYFDRVLGDLRDITLGYPGIPEYEAEMLPYLASIVPFFTCVLLLLAAALLFNKKNILV